MNHNKTLLKKAMKNMQWMPKKFLGQNFLINQKVIDQIIEAARACKPQFIIEAGPGFGALTHSLLAFKRPLCVIEKDPHLARRWQNKPLTLINQDVLKTNWKACLQPGSLFIGNLPYQAASRLLVDCCCEVKHLESMIFMFQKEVAARIKAPPGVKQYGLLSVLAQNFWTIKTLCTAFPHDFYPPPKVAGEVIVFQKKQPGLKLLKAKDFTRFVKTCFAHRRKLLINNLKAPRLNPILKKLKISVEDRAETLPPQTFIRLFKELSKKPRPSSKAGA